MGQIIGPAVAGSVPTPMLWGGLWQYTLPCQFLLYRYPAIIFLLPWISFNT